MKRILFEDNKEESTKEVEVTIARILKIIEPEKKFFEKLEVKKKPLQKQKSIFQKSQESLNQKICHL
jgi:hypothetical protein